MTTALLGPLLSAAKRTAWRLRRPDIWQRYSSDFREFAASVRPLVEELGRTRRENLGEVLFHSIHGFAPSYKEEFALGAVLARLGWRPVYLVRSNAFLDRYVRMLPGARLVHWNDQAALPTSAERSLAVRLVDGVRNFRELVDLSVDDCAIGRNSLSWLMRQRRLGKIDLVAHRGLVIDALAESLGAARASRALLGQEHARVVLMNERGYTPFGEFFDLALAEGRRVVQWVASHRDDARVFKAYTAERRTEHPYSLSPHTWSRALTEPFSAADRSALLSDWEASYRNKSWFNFQQLAHHAEIRSRGQIASSLGLRAGHRVAVIYAHIFWDATFFYGSSLFDDYEQWFVETVRAANRNDRLDWIVKLHPVNVWRYAADGVAGSRYSEIAALERAGIQLRDHVKLLMPDTDISSWSLFHASDYCLTVRGTVGIENAALGRLVVTAGSGHYSERGFTLNPASVEDYLDVVDRLETYDPPPAEWSDRAQRYAHWLLRRKAYAFDGFAMEYSAAPDVYHPLNGRLCVRESDPCRLLDSPRARAWVRWLVDGEEEDCLVAG